MREASRWDIFDEKVVGFELTLPGVALGTQHGVVEYVGQLTRVTFRDAFREYSAEHEDEVAAWLKVLALRLGYDAVLTETEENSTDD